MIIPSHDHIVFNMDERRAHIDMRTLYALWNRKILLVLIHQGNEPSRRFVSYIYYVWSA